MDVYIIGLFSAILCSLSLVFVHRLAGGRRFVASGSALANLFLVLSVVVAVLAQSSAGALAAPTTRFETLFQAYLPVVRRGFPTPPPTPTATPSPSPTATPMGRLCDDFSDPASGWKVDDTVEFSQGYRDGEYRIYVKEADKGGGAIHPTFVAANYRVDVDARFVGDTYGAYGLLFAVTPDEQSSYMFLVWEAGYWAFWRILGGQSEMLFDNTASPYILPAQNMNHLHIVRQGWKIHLGINGHEIAVFEDYDLVGNLRVGVLAGAEDLSGLDARFDNFCVTPLQP